MLGVLVEESHQRFIVALADEVGFAHGGVGKRRIEGRSEKRDKNTGEEAGPDERHETTLLLIRR